MAYGMYMSAAGADMQSRRMEVLSNNLANVDTTGFKRELAILQARNSEAIDRGEAVAGTGSRDDIGGGVRMSENLTDFSEGVLKKTDIPTDMAINGDGFFLVEKDGRQLLTRAGNFQFRNDGHLVTQNGYAVLDESESPVALDPTLPWHLLPSGVIDQAGTQIPLAIRSPASYGDLVKVGETMFSALAPPNQVPVEQRNVVGGFLEGSTVSPTTEMMQLIETSRALEANVKMIQNHDSMNSTLISRILQQS